MATLAELATLHARGTNDTEALLDKIRGAVLVAAEVIHLESTGVANHAERLLWAKEAFKNPRIAADELWGAIIGANNASTTSQILTANDAAIQTAVNNAINLMAI